MNTAFINKRKKELGFTNPTLAEASGIPLGTLSKIVAGIVDNPQLETMRMLAKALKCTIDDFTNDEYSAPEEFVITDTEKLLILSYRNSPNMQDAVNRLLGIDSPSLNTVKVSNR